MYVIGIDLGTSGVKALLISENGDIVSRAFEEYPLYTPFPGWSEQKPEEWWEAVKKVIKVVSASVRPEEIVAISFSGQMHGAVFLDKDGEVIRPAILWNDTRTFNERAWITQKAGGESNLIQMVGNPPLEGFTLPKIIWLRNNEPENFSKLHKVLLPKDYIVYKLTGRMVSEVSDAAGTAIYDVKNRKWSEELAKILELDISIFPEVIESFDVAGKVSKKMADEIGLSPNTLVIPGGADNACGAVGNGIIKEGLFLGSVGTSGVVLSPTSQPKFDPEGRIHFFNHSVPNMWYNMGVILSAGFSLSWFKNNFAKLEGMVQEISGISAYEIINAEVEKVPIGSEALIFLPYLNGERTPHKDAKVRGAFIGISARHTKAHFARAVMEGVTYALRDSLEIMKSLGILPVEVRITGGGAKSKVWQQIMADIFKVEVKTIQVDEGPAFGAAIIAAVGSKLFNSFDEAAEKFVKLGKTIEPIEKNSRIYDELYEIFRSLYPALKDKYEKLFNIAVKTSKGDENE
ncbi:MAG: xylulokinase [Thermotogaceae bacterium]|jgi:xylulokinase|nr:xylulokinase [Thermotogaceae bacterium]MDN5338116.1 xylulokinase [Thermotogaceae bacterium]